MITELAHLYTTNIADDVYRYLQFDELPDYQVESDKLEKIGVVAV